MFSGSAFLRDRAGTFWVESLGALSGSLILQGSSDSPGAVVQAGTAWGGSDVSGSFVVPMVPSGVYTVTASMPCYTLATWTNVVVTANLTTTLSPVTLVPQCTLTGRVGSIAGRPDKGGVRVSLTGPTSVTATTAADGAYTATGLADANYTVTVSMPGYLFTSKSLPITEGQATVISDATLYPGDLKVDTNNRLDLFDLILLGGNWQKTAPTPW